MIVSLLLLLIAVVPFLVILIHIARVLGDIHSELVLIRRAQVITMEAGTRDLHLPPSGQVRDLP